LQDILSNLSLNGKWGSAIHLGILHGMFTGHWKHRTQYYKTAQFYEGPSNGVTLIAFWTFCTVRRIYCGYGGRNGFKITNWGPLVIHQPTVKTGLYQGIW